MRFPRASGILLHPTSLPGPGGVGSLGPSAYRFLETLDRAGQRIWQVLPLGPTGYADSPYQSPSAFAGNPLLVSPELLVENGLLEEADLGSEARAHPGRVEYPEAGDARRALLARAWTRFGEGHGPDGFGERFDTFRAEQAWLADFTLFYALKEEHGGGSWLDWPEDLRRREPSALDMARDRLRGPIDAHAFAQFLFFEQWHRLRDRARELGIAILGDVPIFVAEDSADVWANPELYDLDEHSRPRVVAGVPPDYFSETGQLWGNPLYRWDAHAENGYAWWIERMRASLAMYDRVRIDHFRAFHDYWEIAAAEETAIHGQWLLGPGAALFDALGKALGELPVVAEDLGDLHDAVFALRDDLDLPGMRVLHFGFAPDPKFDGHSPHGHIQNCAVYTGTHDNDTTRGWFEGAANTTVDPAEHEEMKKRVLRYTGTDGSEIHWDLIRLALMSVADTAIVPLQDVLGLGTHARMNVPGTVSGNWAWRLDPDQLGDGPVDRLKDLTFAFGR